MAPAMFVGFDVIPQASEEMNYPIKHVGWLVLLAIGLGALWYIMMIIGAAFAAPQDFLRAASIPLADAASHVLGHKIYGSILIVAGIGGILTSWNAMFIGATRILFAMSRAKMLPPVFARLHPKYKSPTAAITLVGGVGMLAPLLGKNALGWFVNASSFGTVLAYLTVVISFIILRKKEPDLARPWVAPGGTLMGVAGLCSCVFFILLYLPVGLGEALVWPYEWGMVLLWCVLGVVFMSIGKSMYRNVSEAEREYLMCGEEYARKEYLRDYLSTQHN
jgi:amino acid transporter